MTNSDQHKKTVVIVGDGIAAWCVINQLMKRQNLNLIHIADFSQVYAHNCSLHSTSINCLRGTKKDLSPLGDLLVDSIECFEQFYHESQPEGVYLGEEVQFWNEHGQWPKRYPQFSSIDTSKEFKSLIDQKYYFQNKAYFISGKRLKKWFEGKWGKNIQRIDALVIDSSEKKQLSLSNGDIVHYDDVIYCTNGQNQQLVRGKNKDLDYYLDHSKFVAGSYLECNLNGLKVKIDKNINFAIGKHHVIYRKDESLFQIGSTSNNKTDFQLADDQGIKKIYQTVQKRFIPEIPQLREMQVKTGIRFKGHKRMPFWGKISDNQYIITGLYKNGFSFSFKAGLDVDNALNQDDQ